MVPVARITRLFGTNGGVLLLLFDTFPEDFDAIKEPFFLMVDNLTVPVWCERFEPHGATGAFAVFSDLDSEERIREFVGSTLYVGDAADGEGDDDDFFFEDLIGFGVEADGVKGRIIDYYDSDANPLFGIEFAGREVLVPAAEEFIVSIDFEHRRLKMTLPDGLLDL